MNTKIKDGDWVVEATRFGIECRKVVRVTAALIFCDQSPYLGHRRIRIDQVKFSGTEAEAKQVAARLVSSVALYNEECRKSHARLLDRDEKILSEAQTAKGETA